MDVAILLFEGFDELDAIGPFEVFGYAADEGADIAARLVSLDGSSPVTASHGTRVEADGSLPDLGAVDLLVVPGGGWNDRNDAGAWAEAEAGEIPDAVTAHHDAGATVASVCTGGMLLSTAGILSGRPAVTHAGALADLRETDAVVPEKQVADSDGGQGRSSGHASGQVPRVVDDGDVLTAGGVTAGIDLALHIVEREASAEIAASIARTLEYDRTEDVYVGE